MAGRGNKRGAAAATADATEEFQAEINRLLNANSTLVTKLEAALSEKANLKDLLDEKNAQIVELNAELQNFDVNNLNYKQLLDCLKKFKFNISDSVTDFFKCRI